MVDRRHVEIQLIVKSEQIGFALIVDDAGMIAGGARAGVHDLALMHPRPGRPLAHRIADPFGAAGRCVGHVIVARPFVEPRPFLIIGWLGNLLNFAGIGHHALVQLDVPQAGIAPVEIGLPVIVDPHGRVDIAIARRDQRLADRILERTFRSVRYGDGDHILGRSGHADRRIKVEFAIAFDHLRRPGIIALHGPGKSLERSDDAPVGPVDHVGRTIQPPVEHLEPVGIILVMAGVEIHHAIMHERSRVRGKAGLDDRIVGLCSRPGQYHRQRHDSEKWAN